MMDELKEFGRKWLNRCVFSAFALRDREIPQKTSGEPISWLRFNLRNWG
jgi:hypothetical protein